MKEEFTYEINGSTYFITREFSETGKTILEILIDIFTNKEKEE